MSPNTTFQPPRKKFNVLWLLAVVLVLVVGLFLVQLMGPSPAVIVSPQTTYISESLRPEGLPDYEAYLRDRQREGITRENNAAVLLFQALWPANLEPEHYSAVAAELGLNEIPSKQSALQPLHGDATRARVIEWLPKRDESEEEPDADAIIKVALDHPWTSEQLPPLAEWADANQKSMDLIVEASRRPRYYSPSPTYLDNRHDTLISVLLPGAQSLREGARALKVRAMRHIGENRLKEAWQDNLAMFRLSSLAAQGPTLVEQLVSMAIRTMACQTTTALLSSDQLDEKLARQIQKDLAAVPPYANVTNCIDQTERLSCLDAVVHMRLYGIDALSDQVSSGNSSPMNYASIDWNIILRHINDVFDEVVAALRVPDRAGREQAIKRFYAKLDDSGNRLKQPSQVMAAFFSRSSRSEVIGTILTNLLVPALDAAIVAEERTNSVLMLEQLAAAIAVYRTNHGAYPEKLDDLAPDVLDKLPVDLYYAKSFVYKRVDQGYLLYTVGENGVDDGGNNSQMEVFEGRALENIDYTEADPSREKIPNGADDYSIRIPVSPFQLPKNSAGDGEP